MRFIVFQQSTILHRSESDLCHHHALFENCFIVYSSFFFATLRAFGFDASPAAFAGFLLAVLFNLALIFLRFLETPNDPFERFPFLDFLSPLPIERLNYVASIRMIFGVTNIGAYFFLSVSCKTDNPATPESNDPASTAIFEPSIK